LTAFNNFIHSAYVTSGTYNVNANHNVFEVTAGTTNVLTGGSLTATYVRSSTLSIAAGTTATIRANPTATAGTSKVSNLLIAGTTDTWTGKLDLTNNDLIVQSTAANAAGDLARITNQLKQGYNNGTWMGTSGIASSTAAPGHALGVLLNNNEQGGTIFSAFDGLAVDQNSILIKYTLNGDTNLDGSVGVADLGAVASHFGATAGMTWGQGDFDYNGTVDVADLGALATTYGQSYASGGAVAPTALIASALPLSPSSLSPVPEPSSAVMLSLLAAGMLGNRARRGYHQSSSNCHVSSSKA
jgi:hypothetical protein